MVKYFSFYFVTLTSMATMFIKNKKKTMYALLKVRWPFQANWVGRGGQHLLFSSCMHLMSLMQECLTTQCRLTKWCIKLSYFLMNFWCLSYLVDMYLRSKKMFQLLLKKKVSICAPTVNLFGAELRVAEMRQA